MAGELEILACKRYFSDLETGHERGLYFDEDAAQHALDFYQYLRHSKGRWAGQPIQLEGWQAFIIINLFGWMREKDGFRRFRTGYEEVARKNGKSTSAAGVGLYGLSADDEGGAEVYAAATKRDQAKITFDEAVRMVQKSPPLRKRIKKGRDTLYIQSTSSKFEPLSADYNSMDGLNVHVGIVDELHAHKNSGVWDVLESATGARDQSLMFAITTAGFNKNGFCFQLRDYAIKVLRGLIEDDTFFAMIFTLDKEDDPFDPVNWRKANPNLGVSVSLDDLARKAKKAREIPSNLNNFLTKHLNIWTNSSVAWMNMDKWAACGEPFDPAELEGAVCYGGLDLGLISDVAAFVLVFRQFVTLPDGTEAERVRVLCKFYLPEDSVDERTKTGQVPYQQWADAGLFTLTPGNVTDYNFIEADIKEACQRFKVREIAFDRYNASQLVNNLTEEGVPMVGFGQGFTSMNPAMKETERQILTKILQHGDNPVLNWMASNVMAKKDPAGNIKPDKEKSMEKIDGIVALIMAIGRLMLDDGDGDSIYETRGIISF